MLTSMLIYFFFFQAEDGIRDVAVTGVQTCALPISAEAKKPTEEEEYGDVAPPPCEAKAGINRVWWDLRSERTTQIRLRPTPLYASDVPFGPEGWRKPPARSRLAVLAAPGTYTVTLILGEAKFTQKLTVLKDPHTDRKSVV